MIDRVLLDTGVLIAAINRRDRYHPWALEQLAQIVPPLLTCEAVLAEASHLATRADRPADEPLRLVERGVVQLAFDLGENLPEVLSLMERYRNVPMSLADACLVRLSELVADCTILTLDADFLVYRRHGRQRIPLLTPVNR